MILRGGIRGNSAQLSEYLITKAENEYIRILEVDGRDDADEAYLHQTIASMGLMAEMTKSQKAFYHAQINPAYHEDKQMDKNQSWSLAADILAKELGYEGQRRVIVLHQKKGRIHAHVVFERYKYETGKLVDNKQSRLKQDKARQIMEQVFIQQPTPRRNTQKTALREEASEIWQQTATGREFVLAARKAGYIVAEGTANRPFMIVDSTGRSFDLVRQLDKVKTKEVRARLRDEELIPEKRAIEMMREEASTTGKSEQATQAYQPAAEKMAQAFAENRPDTVIQNAEERQRRRNADRFNEFTTASPDLTRPSEPVKPVEQQRKEAVAQAFAQNRPAIVDSTPEEQQKRKNENTAHGFMEAKSDIIGPPEQAMPSEQQRKQAAAQAFAENSSLLSDKEVERQERLSRLIAEQEQIKQKKQQKPKQ